MRIGWTSRGRHSCSRIQTKRRMLKRFKQTQPTGTGPSRATLKRLKDAAEALQIQTTHDDIWAKRPVCQYCGGTRQAECLGLPDQMHEDPPRSQTRGRPPDERFNIFGSGRACAACHRELTGDVGVKMKTKFLSDRGFDGPIEGVKKSW